VVLLVFKENIPIRYWEGIGERKHRETVPVLYNLDDNLSLQNNLKGFDDTSNIWLEPFSALINCMFPVEYVYADWLGWQTNAEAQRADPESLIGLPDTAIEAGSRAEGFCIPQFILRKVILNKAVCLISKNISSLTVI